MEETAHGRAPRQEKPWCAGGTRRRKPGVAGLQAKKQVVRDEAGEMQRGLISPHGP